MSRLSVAGLSVYLKPFVAITLLCGASTLDLVGNWSVSQLWLPAALGSLLPTLGFFMTLFLAPVAVFFAIGGLVGLVARQHRAGAGLLLLSACAIGGISLSLLVSEAALPITTPLKGLSMRLRIKGFAHLAEEAEPIVRALHRFELDQGKAAGSLESLVPKHLSSMPSWAGRLRYYTVSAPEGRELYGNSWILWVNAGFGLGFDSFVYFPNQTYPAYMYGGGPERVGSWVYVHE